MSKPTAIRDTDLLDIVEAEVAVARGNRNPEEHIRNARRALMLLAFRTAFEEYWQAKDDFGHLLGSQQHCLVCGVPVLGRPPLCSEHTRQIRRLFEEDESGTTRGSWMDELENSI